MQRTEYYVYPVSFNSAKPVSTVISRLVGMASE